MPIECTCEVCHRRQCPVEVGVCDVCLWSQPGSGLPLMHVSGRCVAYIRDEEMAGRTVDELRWFWWHFAEWSKTREWVLTRRDDERQRTMVEWMDKPNSPLFWWPPSV